MYICKNLMIRDVSQNQFSGNLNIGENAKLEEL